MTTESYFEHLCRHLKDFSPQEQADILAEIRSHIESGEEDAAGGNDPSGRRAALIHELGSPDQMGKGFRRVYRPSRWIDCLLAVIPAYVIFSLVQYLVVVFGTKSAPDIMDHTFRVNILVVALVVAVAVWRRSELLLLFWVPQATGMVTSFLVRQGITGQIRAGWAPGHIFWLVVLCALLVWLGILLWQNRRDWLLLVFVAAPLLTLVANLVSGLAYAHTGLDTLPYPDWWIQGQLAMRGVSLAGLALFFLAGQRDLRWSGLIARAAISSTSGILYFPALPWIGVLWGLYGAGHLLVWGLDLYRGRDWRSSTHIQA